MSRQRKEERTKAPIRVFGVLFAALLNLILVSLVGLAAGNWQWARSGTLMGVAGAAIVAGVLTALYIGRRCGIHAFLGGMISVPLVALLAFPGDWQVALYAGAFCALAGLCIEKFGPARYRGALPDGRRKRST